MKNLILGAMLAMLLSACASTKTKEDTGSQMASPEPAQQTAKDVPAAAAEPVMEKKMTVNPLTDPTNILSKRGVYFDYDKYDIKPEFKPLIEAHAKYLMDHGQASVRLEGNADERGSREYNLALGQKRAVAVKKFMNALGVPDRQIETISYGEERPSATGHDDMSWAENRRTDIFYVGE